MKNLILKAVKPVLVMGGIGTSAAGINAFSPQFAVENIQNLEWEKDYTIFVQHWGFTILVIGIFMVIAGFKKEWEIPVILIATIEKAFMAFLAFVNFGEASGAGFLIPGIMDFIMTVFFVGYLIAIRDKSLRG